MSRRTERATDWKVLKYKEEIPSFITTIYKACLGKNFEQAHGATCLYFPSLIDECEVVANMPHHIAFLHYANV